MACTYNLSLLNAPTGLHWPASFPTLPCRAHRADRAYRADHAHRADRADRVHGVYRANRAYRAHWAVSGMGVIHN